MYKGLILGCLIALNLSQTSYPPPDLQGDTFTFSLPDMDGNRVSSADEQFKDKVILVDLWGTWCPPCRQAVPFLVELQDRYKKDGLMVVGVAFEYGDTAEARAAKVRKFASERKINYLLLDAGGGPDDVLKQALPDIKATHAFPTMVIIGRDSKVQFSKSGFIPNDKETIEAELKKILAD